MKRVGIILAGGMATRLLPATQVVSKHLIPIFDKPMIYYPISTLLLADITEILIITSKEHMSAYKDLLKDGSQWGINFLYCEQNSPRGIAEAFILGEEFIDNRDSVLVLGDNIFHGYALENLLISASKRQDMATIFAFHVNNPERYGVISFDETGNATGLEEKPTKPQSNYAVTGLYFFDSNISDYAKMIKPSARGELEITDLIQLYLDNKKLSVEIMDSGYTWLDTGTNESLIDASNFIHTLQIRQGKIISSPEEIVWKKGYIDNSQLKKLADSLINNDYGKYLLSLLK